MKITIEHDTENGIHMTHNVPKGASLIPLIGMIVIALYSLLSKNINNNKDEAK